MADFILRALAAGLLVALIAGPLGCFVVWRRMAYFGDTLAHSALLGISFGILIDINLQLAIILACLAIALLLVKMESRHHLATDTILGILAHSSLAFGLVILSFTDVNIDRSGNRARVKTHSTVKVLNTEELKEPDIIFYWHKIDGHWYMKLESSLQ